MGKICHRCSGSLLLEVRRKTVPYGCTVVLLSAMTSLVPTKERPPPVTEIWYHLELSKLAILLETFLGLARLASGCVGMERHVYCPRRE